LKLLSSVAFREKEETYEPHDQDQMKITYFLIYHLNILYPLKQEDKAQDTSDKFLNHRGGFHGSDRDRICTTKRKTG
jgi:hypothetical protein